MTGRRHLLTLLLPLRRGAHRASRRSSPRTGSSSARHPLLLVPDGRRRSCAGRRRASCPSGIRTRATACRCGPIRGRRSPTRRPGSTCSCFRTRSTRCSWWATRSWARRARSRWPAAGGWAVLPAIVAAIAFGCSGPIVSAATLVHHLCGAAWLPWTLWALEGVLEAPSRRRVALLALTLAGQALAGSAEMCAMSALAAFLRWPFPRRGPARKGAPAPVRHAGRRGDRVPGVGRPVDAHRRATRPARAVRDSLPRRSLFWSTHPATLADLFVPRLFSEMSMGRGRANDPLRRPRAVPHEPLPGRRHPAARPALAAVRAGPAAAGRWPPSRSSWPVARTAPRACASDARAASALAVPLSRRSTCWRRHCSGRCWRAWARGVVARLEPARSASTASSLPALGAAAIALALAGQRVSASPQALLALFGVPERLPRVDGGARVAEAAGRRAVAGTDRRRLAAARAPGAPSGRASRRCSPSCWWRWT